MGGSFDDLPLPPELVEALAAEGIERPTELQEAAIPVVHRGHNLVTAAGPGSGLTAATTLTALARYEPSAEGPVVLHITATRERASALASSLGRLAAAVGQRAAATDGPWVLPERAGLLVSTPADALAWIRSGRLSLAGLGTLVIDSAAALVAADELPALESLLEAAPDDTQRIVATLPLTPEVSDLVERHVRRAVHLPPRSAQGVEQTVPDRGELAYLTLEGERDLAVAILCESLLTSDDARHVVLFTRSEDDAADLGDALSARGFLGGAPGSDDVPVWLAVDELEARAAMDEASATVAAVSVSVPPDPDSMDRRHGGGRGGYVFVEPRELPHLRDVARRTGYRLRAFRGPRPPNAAGGLAPLLADLECALTSDAVDVDAYQIVLEPLVREHGAHRLAAALLGMVRAARVRRPDVAPPARQDEGRGSTSTPVKLFISLGQRDGIGPGDLVGAITGEAEIEGRQIGRIDLRETFSLVEVERAVADRVIRALNGTTVRGRAVRVDLDRSERARGRGGRAPGRAGR